MKPITNCRVYDLEESLVASGYAMIEDYDYKEASHNEIAITDPNLQR